jgi:hypothetical protein
MTFFYDLNKRLADLAKKQDAVQVTESKKIEAVTQSKLTQALNESDYSAKRAAAGKDIGKPGKAFAKIAKSAGERYGSKAAGERVAGAVLNKLRAKESVDEADDHKETKLIRDLRAKGLSDKEIRKELEKIKSGTSKHMPKESSMDESALQAYIGDKKYGKAGMDALRKAGREGASRDKMSQIRNRYNKMDEADMEEGNEFSGELAQARASGAKEFEVDGKSYPVQEDDVDDFIKAGGKITYGKPQKGPRSPGLSLASRHIGGGGDKMRPSRTGRAAAAVGGKPVGIKENEPMTPKQKSFAKLAPPADKITFADKIAGAKKEVDEMLGDVAAEAIKGAVGKKKEPRSKGTAFDPEVLKTMTSTDPHPRYDVKDTGYSKRYTRKVQDEPQDDAEVSTEPKKKGRPKGPEKGPERVTKGSYKFKSGRPAKTNEGDMDPADSGEYDREGDMAKEQMHTIMSAAKELHSILRDEENLPEWVQKKITLAKEYIDTARDYMLTQHAERAEEQPIAEKAVSVAQRRAAGIAHAAQKGEIPKKELRGASKEMAKMPKGELKKFAKTKETGLPKKADEGKGDGNLANNAKPYDKVTQGDVVAGRLGKDEMGGKKKKEDKVDETTVAGSVATAPAGKKSSGGYNFGGGVYESINAKVENMITEGMNVSVNMASGPDGNPTKNITVSADGEDAEALAMLLKMAGIGGQDKPCASCGQAKCGCEMVDENSPDWPTNTETLDAEPNLRTYSGGLNGPKSTGQTTIPVVASQLRRQVSMEESAELERSLFKTWKNYKG